MKYYISYPYQIRFMPTNALILSTMKYDPKWLHAFKGQSHYFFDERGVLNGLRAEPLIPDSVHDLGVILCGKNCQQPIPCEFMKKYSAYLQTVDFDDIIRRCESLAKRALPNEKDPFVVFLVNEPPYIKCAERPCLVQWFAEHGIELKEWER